MYRIRLKFLFRRIAVFAFIAPALILTQGQCSADIYKYVDKNGVLHFTNIPTRGGYTLMMREKNTAVKLTRASASRYDRIIREASAKHGVDFNLIKAVIKVESSFNPKAVSRAGAKGLMQVMPENYSLLGITDPHDPRQSILGGAQYLNSMIKRFDGKIALALAAYNAGPTAVEKYNNIPPYKETRRYVSKVIKEYRRLRQEDKETRSKWRVVRFSD